MVLTRDEDIRELLTGIRTIAMVGASDRPDRPSYHVMEELQRHGYRVIPVNPQITGEHIHGEYVFRELAQIGEPIDMVDIFRNAEAAGPIVDEALALTPKPKIIWMQLGVRNDEAAAKAEAVGLKVVMNRCPKIEYGRLSGEIGWTGVNSRTISARKPVRLGQGVQRLSIAPRGPVKPQNS